VGIAGEIPVQDIVDAIRRLIRSVYRDSQKISRRFGLTGSQSAVMRNLLAEGPLSSAALSRKLYVTAANITGIVDRLEKRRLVKRIRQTGDRRVTMIGLTESGKTLAQKLPDPFENRMIEALSRMEASDVRNLGAALHQINRLIDVSDSDESPLELDRDLTNHL
jgi:DNA-binding MarR family transcriptional regulator